MVEPWSFGGKTPSVIVDAAPIRSAPPPGLAVLEEDVLVVRAFDEQRDAGAADGRPEMAERPFDHGERRRPVDDEERQLPPRLPGKDFEATIEAAQVFLYAASVMLLTRRLARAS